MLFRSVSQSRYAVIIETNGRRRAQKWWLPSGVLESDVLAAYQFKNSISETSSYNNLVNPGTYTLYKNNANVGWVIDKGVFIPAYHKAGLDGFGKGYISCAIRFSDVDVNANTEIGLTSPINGYYLSAKTASGSTYYKTPGCSKALSENQPLSRSNESMSNGVLGYTRSLDKLYQNGVLKTLTTSNWTTAGSPYYCSIGNATRQSAPARTMGTVYIQAVVFYDVALSDDQHAELAEKMNAN